jgi:predicted dehydrogenase
MSTRCVNIGVIGWGNFFKHIHEQTLRDLVQAGRCRVRAVCVRTEATRNALAKAYRTDYATADYQQLLADKDLDAVVIGAPHTVQAPVSIDALKAGKWVYVEKPMFAEEAETGVAPEEFYRQLQALGQPALDRLAVGLNKRFAPAYRQIRDLAASWNGLKCIRMSIVDDAWRWGAKYPPGFLMWLDVCHWLDLARWMTGAEIDEVSCLTPQVEDSLVTLRMSNGAVVSIFLSGNGTMDMIKEELHVTSGARRCASAFDYVQLEVFGGAACDVRVYPANLQTDGDTRYVDEITRGGLEAFRSIRRAMYDRYLRVQAGQAADPSEDAYVKRNLPNFMRPQGWKESLGSFVDSVATGQPSDNCATYRDAYVAYLNLVATKRSVDAGGGFIRVPRV